MAIAPRSKSSAPRLASTKIKSPKSLARTLKSIRGCRKVVFTNGCFDILHPGHVSYLEQARRQGDILVVALNGDDSVRRLKGPERPLNELSDRSVVMAGLECVDYVTWFDTDTPRDLILLLKPDVLVKGGDWKPADIVGGPEVLSWGGKVKSLKFIEGKSTTNIIGRMKR